MLLYAPVPHGTSALIHQCFQLVKIGYEYMLFSIALSGMLAPRLFINLRKISEVGPSGISFNITTFHARTRSTVSHWQISKLTIEYSYGLQGLVEESLGDVDPSH